jgi:hypothetical protein
VWQGYYAYDYGSSTPAKIKIGYAGDGLSSINYLAAYGTDASGNRVIKDVGPAVVRSHLSVPQRDGTDATGTWGISITGNAATATKLKTGRTLKVSLGSTSASTAFDGSANVSDIGVSGTLAVSNGGTGRATLTSGYALVGNGTGAVSLRGIRNNVSVGGLGWTSATADTVLVTANTIAYWDGSYNGTTSNLSKLGTITTGTWNGSTIGVAYGGTGRATLTSGSVLVGNGTSAVSLRSITNNTSAKAVSASTNLITANTLYYHTGNSNITTVGTITSGTWHGSTIGVAYGGTGNTTGTAKYITTGEIGTSSDTHATALKTYFTNNKSTVQRNRTASFYSNAYGNGSLYMGYYLSGYDSNPYGGFFVAHYNVPYYVGI